jgi:uncharacterized phiE125 gp8 family phage protein
MAISTATVKAALKIDYSDDDAELARIISAAVAWVERYTGVGLSVASRTLRLRDWSDAMLPVDPFLSLTSVSYYDSSNVLTTMPSTDYWVDQTGQMPVIRFLEWPSMYEGTSVTVTYSAGWSTEPADLVQVVIALTGLWYNNPEAAQIVNLNSVPLAAQMILEHNRVKGPMS